MNKKVLIAAPVHPVLIEGLIAQGYECVRQEGITQKLAFGLIYDCTGVVTSTRLQLDKELIDAAPALRWIARMGSGMEVVDVDYALQKGIACYSSPEGNCNAVAEHALGMLLSLQRHITRSQQEMEQGIWRREENRGYELEGKTIGIIGYGHTGAAFARKLQGFDMQIMVYDKYKKTGIPQHIVNCETIDPILEQAEIISFHVPLQKDTMHYLNDNLITKVRQAFIVINTSRGSVVDTGSLWNGLQSGKIKGACIDVWEQEPPNPESDAGQMFQRIVALPQVIATPHIAGYTFEALYKMSKVLLYKIIGE